MLFLNYSFQSIEHFILFQGFNFDIILDYHRTFVLANITKMVVNYS